MEAWVLAPHHTNMSPTCKVGTGFKDLEREAPPPMGSAAAGGSVCAVSVPFTRPHTAAETGPLAQGGPLGPRGRALAARLPKRGCGGALMPVQSRQTHYF